MKTLETDRLILREWRESDAEDQYAYAKSDKVGPMAGWKPHESVEESIDTIKNMFIANNDAWAIELKSNNKVIGSIGLHKDTIRRIDKAKMLGYVLTEEYWGQGLIPEAVNRVLEYGFMEEELDIISVNHFPFNTQSKRVIEKAGFKYEGTLRMFTQRYDGVVLDVLTYSITKEEYLNKG